MAIQAMLPKDVDVIRSMISSYGMKIDPVTYEVSYQPNKTLVFVEGQEYPIVLEGKSVLEYSDLHIPSIDPSKVTDIQYSSSISCIGPNAFDGMSSLSAFGCQSESQIVSIAPTALDGASRLSAMTICLSTAEYRDVSALFDSSISVLEIPVDPLVYSYKVSKAIWKALSGDQDISEDDMSSTVDIMDEFNEDELRSMLSDYYLIIDKIGMNKTLDDHGYYSSQNIMFGLKLGDKGCPPPGKTQAYNTVKCPKCNPYGGTPFDPNDYVNESDKKSKAGRDSYLITVNSKNKKGKTKKTHLTKKAADPKKPREKSLRYDVTVEETEYYCNCPKNPKKGSYFEIESKVHVDR